MSLIILGGIGIGTTIKFYSDKQQAKKVEISEQNRVEDQSKIQGQVAGVAITLEPTPTLTTKPYKIVIVPTNTLIPSSPNQPQASTNTPAGSNTQTIQNISTQTSNPIYIPAQQPTTVPTTIPEPTEAVELQISYDSYEGMVYANKYLRSCYFLSAREVEIGYDVGAVQLSVSTNKCYVDSFKSPKYINQKGYVVDMDGQIKYFGSN